MIWGPALYPYVPHVIPELIIKLPGLSRCHLELLGDLLGSLRSDKQCKILNPLQTPLALGDPCQQYGGVSTPTINPMWTCGLRSTGNFTCPAGKPISALSEMLSRIFILLVHSCVLQQDPFNTSVIDQIYMWTCSQCSHVPQARQGLTSQFCIFPGLSLRNDDPYCHLGLHVRRQCACSATQDSYLKPLAILKHWT